MTKAGMTRLAAIYVRISRDREGVRAGVRRQREDCERLCRDRGWEIVEVFEDDDRSAFLSKPRPAYLAMLDALKAGTVNTVVAWHPDRLHRSPTELEDFITVIELTRAEVETVQAGELDLATVAG